MTRLTLQSRITAFMIITSVALIAVFTFLQVNNQLETLTQQNILKSKIGLMLTKNTLENAVASSPEAQQQTKAMSEALLNLKQLGLIEDAGVIDRQGNTVSSINKYSRNIKPQPKEQNLINNLFKSSNQAKQYQSQVDKEKKLIIQYLPVSETTCAVPGTESAAEPVAPQTKIVYVARIFYPLGNISDALKEVYIPCIFIAIIIIMANIILSILLSKTILGPLKILNSASKEISGGKLELRINLPTGDEIEEVANTFNEMTVALVRMKERAENANPLTKLPGNNVIHEEIEKRLNDKRKFVVVYSDLDNFKAFNDKYGIGAGDVAIKLTAQVMQESLKLGNPDDFMGHEGGDDFVLLTVPEKAKAVTDFIISEFDKKIRAIYTKEDLDRGFILAKSREGELRQFPIMTLSLAGVSNIERPLTSYGEITNICASVKKVAKKTPGSVFILDKMPEHL